MYTNDNYEATMWQIMSDNNMTWAEAEEYMTEEADAWN